MPITGFVEGGIEYDKVTQNYGNWFNQYIKSFTQFNEKHALFLELYHDQEFKQQGNYIKGEHTYIYDEDNYFSWSAGISDNSIFVPKYYLGATYFNKQLKNKQLIGYLGTHLYWWRPNSSSEDINPGFVYYFESPWIIEAGAYINQSNPGIVYSASGYVAITQGRDKEHYITFRYGFGKEAYLPLGNNQDVLGYPSRVSTLTWRQWIGKDWGTNIIAENYYNPFYHRYGVTFGIFKEFIE